ncbi:hypothetical protein GCM10011378_37380 [Hymenobacter glacieicola]|uniref:Fibronectin type-III domain-containing protein n=2 Tax=Hymenobacter glacieicola TaxID=1562124 RepID=A0ABQ1X3B6_9BACT|nr:hypothetical protein GCM10011378_37380 [Hymenobacter glacieicola]
MAALLSVGTLSAQAQFAYTTFNSAIGAGTYTDLASTGTAIATPNTDDANSAATPIGFSFQYNGQTFTDFVLNTNGYLKLGTTAPAAPYFYDGPQSPFKGPLDNNAEANLILPFNLDLEGSTAATPEYRVATTGTAPNRVCTIQWKNVSDKASGTVTKQYARANFQVKLYETTNQVVFFYGTFTANASTTDALRTAAVGLKGSGPAPGQTVTVLKRSTDAWNAASFLSGNYTGDVFNVRSSVRPASGLAYVFTAAQAKDASVQTIHTLGKLAVPFSLPHSVVAAVQNRGLDALTNLPVTLTVTGANTFTSTKTVVSLAPGAITTVTFDAYPTTLTQGTNNLTVSVANDDRNENNSLPYTQEVTAGTMAFIDPTKPLDSGIGAASAGFMFVAKHTTSQATFLNEVKVGFFTSASSSNYQVVVLSATAGGTPNAVLYSSPVLVRGTAATTATVPIPSIAVNGNYFIGIREQNTNPQLGYQLEVPLRANTFFYRFATGGWTEAGSAGLPLRLALEATVGAQLTCPIASGATFSNITSNSATITLTGVPASGTGYTIIYGTAGFNPASAGTSVTGTGPAITLTGLVSGAPYDVYIRSNCGTTEQSSLLGPLRFTTACPTNTTVASFPYSENFDALATGTRPCGYTVVDDNNDNNTWLLAPITNSTVGASAPNAMRYRYNLNRTSAANDWFFTPALAVRAGSQYQLTFKYKTLVDPADPTVEKLEVTYGTAATVAAQTTQLWKNEAIQNPTFASVGAGQVAVIKPAADGNIFVGFHAYSIADQYDIYVDDISISSTITASSEALMRAITMFPNPTAGELAIDVRGANTKGPLQVEVLNMLGQRVHTTSIRNNFENKVNLSNLANGMYIVKILAGNEYMVGNVTIQK